MARREEKIAAIKLRKRGMSYSQIKEVLGISKSTLHYWLRDYPLNESRVRELRDWNQQRIERCRETKRRKRHARLEAALKRAQSDIGNLSAREMFIAGLFLYWGEGGKTNLYATVFTNSDPAMVIFFVRWLRQFGVPEEKVRACLQLYDDMDEDSEVMYWSNLLGLPRAQFHRSNIKRTAQSNKSYKRGFGHGTCDISVSGRDLSEYVLSCVQHLQALNT